ncbi:Dehydrogenase/reductase SDR family member 12 [Hondaea fermentalgiana]|uniref:Dehydrogenase/reductase SDR family member 12 n=1 Tax=Hondaea fermentalgiana TaxID=2315210 RepID=A0A2R5GDT0_9STRA|nr:Dehydrogenase/reductase SDR family member 12 [Hondaea fermentalgiana]|eukprot:GBG25954.1 Dehydrogenase/reductase SDR family member 12 [Hondaea fermentalgiana]
MLSRVMAFYNYGRKNFTEKGYAKAPRPDLSADLTGRVYVVTGSNSGIGKEVAGHLFKRGARVYMVCRSKDRAEDARKEICEAHKERQAEDVRLVIADMSLYSGVHQAASEVAEKESKVDGLVCNAGALLDKKVLTDEGVELTFACHFLYGMYHMGKLMLPLLEKSDDPRIVVTTSGGMYNAKLYEFDELLKGPEKGFDGQITYAKAKRAQVAVAEEWAKSLGKVKIATVHPGWTATPGVDKAYGSFSKWLLSPMRTPWEGAEGICFLATTSGSNIETGQLYLDTLTQPKHLHKSTETPPEVTERFMKALEAYNPPSKTEEQKDDAVVSN